MKSMPMRPQHVCICSLDSEYSSFSAVASEAALTKDPLPCDTQLLNVRVRESKSEALLLVHKTLLQCADGDDDIAVECGQSEQVEDRPQEHFKTLSSTDHIIAIHCGRQDTKRTNIDRNVHKDDVCELDYNGTYASTCVFSSARSMIAFLY